ncbi:MAG: urease accessory protein UreE [Deltaproteobacteria bacterium]|nr:urease accessory protein UreE [Deltaproteobacteria bacterium]
MTNTSPHAQLMVTKRLDAKIPVPPSALLTLPLAQRQKSRFRAQLDTGEEVGLVLPRGTVLRDGDLLEAENGLIIEVRSAPEKLSTAAAHDPILLARACYHLGNRHVPVQIRDDRVSYFQDHVLDDMLRALGLEVTSDTAPFEPETGAYHNLGHHH